MTPIRVSVDYKLAEYKDMVREFLPRAMQNNAQLDQRLPWNKPWAVSLVLAVLLPPVFWVKKLRVGQCVFEFTADGLSRTARGHTMRLLWSQVSTVHSLSATYLIELKDGGAMPVPYRVFKPSERAAFESFISLATAALQPASS